MNKQKAIFWGAAAWLLILVFSFSQLYIRYGGSVSVELAADEMEKLGIMAPAIFLMACTLRGVLFLPCGLFSALGGIVFGKLQGTLLTIFGLTAGSILTFYLSRHIGRDWVRRTLRHRYDKYEGYISRDFPYSIFLMRVVPLMPYDAVSCIAGISKVGAGRFIVDTAIGSIPGTFTYVYLGDSLRSMSYKRIALAAAVILFFSLLPFAYRYISKLRL